MSFQDELQVLLAKYGLNQIGVGEAWNADAPDDNGACLLQPFIDAAVTNPNWVGPSKIRYIISDVLDIQGLPPTAFFSASMNMMSVRMHAGLLDADPLSSQGIGLAYAMKPDPVGRSLFVADMSKPVTNTLVFMGDNTASNFKGPRASDLIRFIANCDASFAMWTAHNDPHAYDKSYPLIGSAGYVGAVA